MAKTREWTCEEQAILSRNMAQPMYKLRKLLPNKSAAEIARMHEEFEWAEAYDAAAAAREEGWGW